MGWPKGKPRGERTPGSGKKKGTPNKATQNAREAIAALVENNVPRMEGWLDQIAEKEGPMAAWKCLQDVIEFHVPKLSRAELATDKDNPLKLVIEWKRDE